MKEHKKPKGHPLTRKNTARKAARRVIEAKIARQLGAEDSREPWSSIDPARAPRAATALADGSQRTHIPIGLSTSSVFPLGIRACFEAAARTGYDGVEVMVSFDRASRDAASLRSLVREYQLPILSLHAPTLFFLQFTGGLSPTKKLEDTMALAKELDVPTVVAHPPFRWQGRYAREFVRLVADLEDTYGLELAVENMYPWRLGVRELLPYYPDHDPTDEQYAHVTIDFSHAATAGDDALLMCQAVGSRLAHLHLTDGRGRTFGDEHLVPGDGNQPVAEVLRYLRAHNWYGSIVVEISSGKGRDLDKKLPDIQRSLEFARTYVS